MDSVFKGILEGILTSPSPSLSLPSPLPLCCECTLTAADLWGYRFTIWSWETAGPDRTEPTPQLRKKKKTEVDTSLWIVPDSSVLACRVGSTGNSSSLVLSFWDSQCVLDISMSSSCERNYNGGCKLQVKLSPFLNHYLCCYCFKGWRWLLGFWLALLFFIMELCYWELFKKRSWANWLRSIKWNINKICPTKLIQREDETIWLWIQQGRYKLDKHLKVWCKRQC